MGLKPCCIVVEDCNKPEGNSGRGEGFEKLHKIRGAAVNTQLGVFEERKVLLSLWEKDRQRALEDTYIRSTLGKNYGWRQRPHPNEVFAPVTFACAFICIQRSTVDQIGNIESYLFHVCMSVKNRSEPNK